MIRKGDLVRHAAMPSWGIGSVLYAPRGGNLLIRFDQVGEKLIHPAYAGLTKVPEDDLLYLVVREVNFKWGRSLETTKLIPILKPDRF
jgi:hypothetical protein